MTRRSYIHVLGFALVTCFVTISQAQQQTPKPSQNRTASETSKGLLEAVKYLPKILDNKKINLGKNNFTSPGRFEVNKAYGPGSGGGGNTCAMGIVKLTKDILYQGFSKAALEKDQEQALMVAIQTATFVQGDNLPAVRGEKKNAINFPDLKLIVVDNKACEAIIAGGTPGFSLLVHEYMGLAGIDDRDYRVSLSYIQELFREAPARDGNKPIFKNVIRNVTICAASCQSENLGHEGHNRAYVGVIYYAAATDDTTTNTNVCISEAKEARVISDRRTDVSSNSCLAALSGKYYGQVVDLYTDAPENPRDPEAGRGFQIRLSAKRK